MLLTWRVDTYVVAADTCTVAGGTYTVHFYTCAIVSDTCTIVVVQCSVVVVKCTVIVDIHTVVVESCRISDCSACRLTEQSSSSGRSITVRCVEIIRTMFKNPGHGTNYVGWS